MMNVFKVWFVDRKAVVVCGKKHGNFIHVKKIIYDGIVRGYWLWNLCYEDAKLVLYMHKFLEVMFAVDFNAYRVF